MYTEENYNFDFSHEDVQNVLKSIEINNPGLSDKDFSIKAYNYVRDNWDYYPYHVSLKKEDWRSSELVKRKTGHCIEKAIILIALLRAKNIPSRLGLAKVKNHIAVEKITEKLQNDVLVPHGYAEINLNNKWIKVTPAFNASLCKMLGVNVLEFNGEDDSVFHEFDKNNEKRFMEYLEDYGTFDNVPVEFMFELMKKNYPILERKQIKIGDVLDLTNL